MDKEKENEKAKMKENQLKKALSRNSSYQIKSQQKSILSTMQRHTNILKVVQNGVDVTPFPIPPTAFKGGKERPMIIYDIHKDTSSISRSTSMASKIFKTDSTYGKIQTDYLNLTKRGESIFATLMSTDLMDDMVTDEMETEGDSELESEGTLKPKVLIPEMPKYITLTLYETDTFFVLDIPSSTAERDTPEGVTVDAENKYYEYLTTGKGRNRKVFEAEVQTVPLLLKSRETEAKKQQLVNIHTFASLWDMYDTFNEEDEQKHTGKPVNKSNTSIDSIAMPKEDFEMLSLLQNQKFLESICIMQRILANNVFNEQQKRFRGLNDPSPFREDIEYKYTLNFLWTFANEDTKDRCVTALSWNPENKDILAVGYGKFFYDEDTTGLALIWNIKNPVQPERTYRFQMPVTCLDFSRQNPNYLGIGFYNGDVTVLDISSRNIVIVGLNDKQVSQMYEPIWQVRWYTDHDYYKGQEFLVATCQDGRICKFRTNSQNMLMHYSQLMHITSAEGKLKGIATIRKCPTKAIPLTRHSPALVYTPHPVDPNIYYIGTGEGVVHKCSKNYYHQHLDLFLAHDSPMYDIAFSPFCNKLFLTCGDDWAVRLWADGISEPLFEIKKKMNGVQGVAWSPSHSTVIASISGNEIFIWDLQRKTYDSQSSTVSPTKSRNTLIKFTDDGRCLLVADLDGNVHVFSLEDMPFAAFFQENLLTQSIKRALITRPDLLNRIDKLGNLNYDPDVFDRFKS